MNNFSMDNSEKNSYLSISTILNALDAAVYVADLETYEMIFMNKFALENWGEITGETCYSMMQKGQDQPCSFCTNHLIVDDKGEPTGVHVWEFQNTINNNWYECRDQAIKWIDGRLVRMEIAIDITKRKEIERKILLAKEEAEVRAYTDELTQVGNRRAIFEYGEQILSNTKESVSLVMIDIDYFKKVNDAYGHIVGDKVLQKMATLIKKNLRKEDVFGRVGGEEFALILPQADLKIATAKAEALCRKINTEDFMIGDIVLNVSCSFGVTAQVSGSFDEMYSNADNALYKAKNNGRNRVEGYKVF